MWHNFLSALKQADSIVCNQLPSASQSLDTMFSSLVCDLKTTVYEATSGPFRDPSQDQKEIILRLNNMCLHVYSLRAKLEEISRSSENLHGKILPIIPLNDI